MCHKRCHGYFSPNGVLKNVVFIIILLSWSSFVVVSNARKLAENDQVRSLIAFKKSSVESDPNGFLNGWTLSSSSPCTWNGISCSNGQVVELNLSSVGLGGPLHLTDLMALPTLLRVFLNGNHFYGNLSSIASSCSFEFLDLSANNFTEVLVLEPLLKSCDKIKYLNASGNSIPGVVLKFGPSLLQLDLSSNTITDSGILSYALSNCQNLNLLNLSSNKLAGKLKSSLTSCKSLSILDLSHNNLTGELNDLDFGTCQNLTVLNLSFNNLTSTEFPPSLANCQSLNTLIIGHNSIRMEIPAELLVKLKSLKRLVLSNNQFMDKIPSELGQTCSTLEELDLSGNRLNGELPSTFKLCSSLFSLNLGHNELSGDFLNTVISSLTNLRYLYLPFNNITGYVPRSLVNCTKLQVLDLSSNMFIGNVPSEFCLAASGFPLETMLLAGNYLTGTVPKQLGQCRNLRKIDLSFNSLTGSVPLEIWTLPNLSELVMWANNLTGEIPEGICINGGNLQTLILNDNSLSGTLPQSIANCTNLVWVSLSSNRLSGEIPQGIGNLVNLAILQLGNNSLAGPIPRELGACRNLIWLDLNSNALTGSIPPELADQAGLVNPGMASGKPFAFVRNEGGTECRGAGGLVEFEGIREERLDILPMVHFCPSTRIYSGRTMYTFARNGSMIFLDLSYNSLSGTIPDHLGSLSYLQVLNLGHNNFTGTIPYNFGDLKIVGVLDLSHNSLQGFIPASLGGISFLSDLDVSNNNLSGAIPSGGQLTTFPASRYENNSGLCGVPLPPCGSGSGHHSSSIYHHGNKKPTTIGMVVGIMVSFVCIILLFIALYRIKKTQIEEEKRDKYIDSLPTSGSSSWKLSTVPEPLSINVATFEKPLRKLTFGHLLEATNGFSSESMIGSGGFGEVYKAQLRDGSTVAIKKLVHVTGQGDREFMAEMETIGKIKHRNLVPLLGYCKIGEERLLVYEYMKWGSLESVLHDGRKGGMFLDWPARKKIAIGSARGLAFLHHSCLPHIIHRDMKSSNVLLDENFEARVSDFGMARLVNALDTHLSVSTLAGTPGYVPPEYYQSFRCTAKGDVYSYGVILLELLSGKRPIDPRVFGDDNNLVGWAKQLHNEKRSHEILDPELITNLSGDAELYHYLKVAFECLDEKSYKRPTMIQVMTKFKELQTDSESDILDGISVKGSIFEESQEREP